MYIYIYIYISLSNSPWLYCYFLCEFPNSLFLSLSRRRLGSPASPILFFPYFFYWFSVYLISDFLFSPSLYGLALIFCFSLFSPRNLTWVDDSSTGFCFSVVILAGILHGWLSCFCRHPMGKIWPTCPKFWIFKIGAC